MRWSRLRPLGMFDSKQGTRATTSFMYADGRKTRGWEVDARGTRASPGPVLGRHPRMTLAPYCQSLLASRLPETLHRNPPWPVVDEEQTAGTSAGANQTGRQP